MIKSVLAAINNDPYIPNFKDQLFMLFQRRCILFMKEGEIKQCWCHKYLRQIKKFGSKKQNIVSSDESSCVSCTWVTVQKADKRQLPDQLSWQDFPPG